MLCLNDGQVDTDLGIEEDGYEGVYTAAIEVLLNDREAIKGHILKTALKDLQVADSMCQQAQHVLDATQLHQMSKSTRPRLVCALLYTRPLFAPTLTEQDKRLVDSPSTTALLSSDDL